MQFIGEFHARWTAGFHIIREKSRQSAFLPQMDILRSIKRLEPKANVGFWAAWTKSTHCPPADIVSPTL